MNSLLTRLGLLAIGIICIGLGVKRISDNHDFQEWTHHLSSIPLSYTPGIPTTEAALVGDPLGSTGTTGFGGASSTYAPQGAEIIKPQQTDPPPKTPATVVARFPFTVDTAPSEYQSALPLLGSYRVAIPADNQWHPVAVIKPNTELRINLLYGAHGVLMFKVGGFSTFLSKQLPANSWYQYDFRTEWHRTIYDHDLTEPVTLLVKSTEMNEYVKIELRKL